MPVQSTFLPDQSARPRRGTRLRRYILALLIVAVAGRLLDAQAEGFFAMEGGVSAPRATRGSGFSG